MAMRFHKYCLVPVMALLLSFTGLKAQTVVFTPDSISCHGAADASMKIELTGGTSTYYLVYINLTNPSLSDSIGPTSNATYTFLNIPPANLCIFYVRDITSGDYIDQYLINFDDKEELFANVSSTNINCFGASNGTITIGGATGGSGQFDYSINGGANWQSLGNFISLPAGFYNVQMRDRNNPTCVKILNPNLQITQRPQLNATVNFTNVTCFNAHNGSITLSSASGGTGAGYQYTITGVAPWSNNTSYSGLNPGTYHVIMRDQGFFSCTRTLQDPLVITQPALLEVNVSIKKGLTCNESTDGQLQANVSGGTGPYTYFWEIRSGSVWLPLGQNTPVAVNVGIGRYQVTVRDINNCGPAVAGIFFIDVSGPGFGGDSIPPPFYYDGSVATTTCQGFSNGSIDMSAHGGVKPYRFSITTGGASGYQADSLFSNLPAGSYQPWVMDDRGCKKTGANVIVASTPNSPVSVTIAANPAGSICPGTSVQFTATPVNGGTAPTYQWRLNGAPVGANQPTYTNAALTNGAQVNVVLTSNLRCTSGNPATSNTLITALKITTAITTQPQPVTQCAGTNATFSVIAQGTNLSYQWRKNGANISGATGSSYTINNIAATDAANYTVVVTGDCGTQTSTAAALTVNPATAVTTQPSPLIQCAGTNATFTVVAAGTNLTYQWRKNGVNIPGANLTSYTINNINAGDAGNYSVRIHSDCGADVTSNPVALTVNPITVITTQPIAVTQCAGTNATFTVVATGTTLTYQWRKDGIDISGATGSSYTINNINAGNAGSYTVRVRGACGADVISNPALLTVNPVTAITTQPQPLTQCAGTNATFNVVANGTNIIYQWRKNGVNIPGATGSSYTINNINAGDAGNYSVLIHSDCGADVTSNAVALTVNPITAITTQPIAVTQCAGTNATFTVVATGTGLTYQWRKDGADISGATGSSYTITGIIAGNAGNYTVRVHSNCGPDIISNPAALTVNPVTAITTQPQPVTQCVGTNATFTVVANGTNIIYQWRKNGVNISGATGSSYTINNINAGDAGNYSVVVHSDCGADVTSNAVALTVNPITAITTQPIAVTQCAGTNATFTVVATGTGLTYQWRKDGADISGATLASYTINNINAGHAGNYTVRVHGNCGADVISNPALLTVNPATAIITQPQPITQCVGTDATFTVVANGTNITYQWRKNGVDIPAATGSSYTINGINAGHAGDYSVRIHSDCGSDVTSMVVTLVVNPATAIITHPLSVTSMRRHQCNLYSKRCWRTRLPTSG